MVPCSARDVEMRVCWWNTGNTQLRYPRVQVDAALEVSVARGIQARRADGPANAQRVAMKVHGVAVSRYFAVTRDMPGKLRGELRELGEVCVEHNAIVPIARSVDVVARRIQVRSPQRRTASIPIRIGSRSNAAPQQ